MEDEEEEKQSVVLSFLLNLEETRSMCKSFVIA